MSDSNQSADVLLENEPAMTSSQEARPEKNGADDDSQPRAARAQGADADEEVEDSSVEGSLAVVGSSMTESAAQDAASSSALADEATDADAAFADEGFAQAALAEEGPTKIGAGDLLTDEELVRAVSALVFASPEPLSNGRLISLLEGPRPGRVTDALNAISARLEASQLPLELRQIAGGWRLMTAPDTSPTVNRLVKARKADKLSPAGLETLAVVAYRQPVSKADIEAIRGVQCGPMLRNLVDRGLAKVTGRADLPGGPLLYGTTKEFLDRFGMSGLGDLPRDGELLKE